MKVPWVNILLLILLLVQTVTGYFGFTNGRESGAWLLVVHGIVAYALVVLFFFKSAVILDAWRRKKRWTGRRYGFVVAVGLLVLTLLSGLLWTLDGPIYLGGFSLVSLHIYLAVPLMGLMLWHAWHMRFIRRVPEATGRRLFLGGLGVAVAGLLLRPVAHALAQSTGVRPRRFTGSFETGSHTPDFPVVSWIADRPPSEDVAVWRLRVEGTVVQAGSLSYEELLAMPQTILEAALDCTGGWYTVQRWQGVALGAVLDVAGMPDAAASVTLESATGYKRRFPIDEARRCLLALGMLEADGAFRPLSHGHGFPARLVAAERRGMEWVKWLAVVRVNETGAGLQSPLPLQ